MQLLLCNLPLDGSLLRNNFSIRKASLPINFPPTVQARASKHLNSAVQGLRLDLSAGVHHHVRQHLLPRSNNSRRKEARPSPRRLESNLAYFPFNTLQFRPPSAIKTPNKERGGDKLQDAAVVPVDPLPQRSPLLPNKSIKQQQRLHPFDKLAHFHLRLDGL